MLQGPALPPHCSLNFLVELQLLRGITLSDLDSMITSVATLAAQETDLRLRMVLLLVRMLCYAVLRCAVYVPNGDSQ